jgi:hypothetical protein
MLVDPLRTIIYCIGNGLSSGAYLNITAVLDSSQINEQVNKIILKDLKTTGPVLQETMNIFKKNNSGYMASVWKKWI